AGLMWPISATSAIPPSGMPHDGSLPSCGATAGNSRSRNNRYADQQSEGREDAPSKDSQGQVGVILSLRPARRSLQSLSFFIRSHHRLQLVELPVQASHLPADLL